MDPIPSAGNTFWDTWWHGLRHNSYVVILSPVHCRVYYGWLKLCGHCLAGPDTRYDYDASAPDNLGNIHGHSSGVASFSSIIGSNSNDAV